MQRKSYRMLGLILLIILLVGLFVIPAEGKPAVVTESKSEIKQPEVKPLYIKHVVIVAIDDLEQKYFTSAAMPRLVGMSKEGIRGNVIDKITKPDHKLQELALVGKLPNYYKKNQRKSVLINGRNLEQNLEYGFSTVLNTNSEDLDNPKKIIDNAINQFENNQPMMTYITFGTPVLSEREKQRYFSQLDEAMGQFFGMLHEQGLYDHTLIIITGRRSSQTTARLAQPDSVVPFKYPLCIKGPNLLAGAKIPTVNLEDLPATILYLTDGKEQLEQGKILWNVISTANIYESQSLLRNRIRDLSAERDQIVELQFSWEKEKINFQQQRNNLEQERQGVNNQLSSRDENIKQLNRKLAIYQGFGIAILLIMLLGYLVQYFILRKRFLLF